MIRRPNQIVLDLTGDITASFIGPLVGDVTGNVTGTLTTSASLRPDSTDASGTPGDATINKPSGLVAIGTGDDSITVTNSLVSATCRILVWFQQAAPDATLTAISVNPGSGSFTITGNDTATADTVVGFLVLGT